MAMDVGWHWYMQPHITYKGADNNIQMHSIFQRNKNTKKNSGVNDFNTNGKYMLYICRNLYIIDRPSYFLSYIYWYMYIHNSSNIFDKFVVIEKYLEYWFEIECIFSLFKYHEISRKKLWKVLIVFFDSKLFVCINFEFLQYDLNRLSWIVYDEEY